VSYTRKHVIGRTILEIRPITPAECDTQGWDWDVAGECLVIVLDNGHKLYPSADEEGDGPGALFGEDERGGYFVPGTERR